MAKIKLFKKQATYVPHDPSKRPPLRCVLVGGRPEYGNVSRLPGRLWKDWGIAVVAHLPPSVKSTPNPAGYDADIAIVLIDMVSHTLSEWSKTLDVEHNIYVPGGWSKISEALQKCDVKPVPGNAYSKPKRAPVSTETWKDALKGITTTSSPISRPVQAVRAAPAPSPPPEAPVTVPDAPAPEPPEVEAVTPAAPTSPTPLSDVLAELKRTMRAEGVQTITATLMRDGTLAIELRKVVVTTESLEV